MTLEQELTFENLVSEVPNLPQAIFKAVVKVDGEKRMFSELTLKELQIFDVLPLGLVSYNIDPIYPNSGKLIFNRRKYLRHPNLGTSSLKTLQEVYLEAKKKYLNNLSY